MKNHNSSIEYQLGSQKCVVEFVRAIPRDWIANLELENALLVTDTQVATALDIKHSERSLTIEAGEAGKSWQSVERILQHALHLNIDRQGYMVALGGGALCDVAAFAAALYLRGIQVHLVPTTLLGMVDAAFGGKCGINFSNYKNMVGSYHAAQKIIINLETLNTLPPAEYLNGIAEVIKSALLGDQVLFDLLRHNRAAILKRHTETVHQMVRRALAVKAAHVSADYREQGIRAHLNLGHTFAHALESIGKLEQWSHGRAVAWGIAQAMKLGLRLGVTDSHYAQQVIELLQQYDFQTEISSLNSQDIIAAMRHDKKRTQGAINCILQHALGVTEIRAVDEETLHHVLITPYR